MAEDQPTVAMAHCNSCRQETRHFVRGSHKEKWTYGHVEYPCLGDATYEILECCGCENVIFRRRVHLEDWDDIDPVTLRFTRGEDITCFPPAAWRPKPEWSRKLSDRLRAIFDETYTALDNGTPSLAMMGARAILDIAMQEKVGDCGTLAAKLDEMLKKHFIDPDEKTFLAIALDAGNAANHRGHVPTPDELGTVIDIVEHILQAIYVLPEAAEKLREKTPPRQKAQHGRQSE